MVPGAVERMTCADRAALLDDALGLWAIYGPKYPGLPRGPDADAAGLADLMPGGEPNGDGPGTAIDVSGLTHPASGGLPAEGIGPAPRPAAPGRSARRPVLHAGRTALGKIATSSEGVAGRTTAAPAPVIARATMNEVRLVDQAAHHRIADEDQQALDERTTAAVPVACRVEHEHRRGVGNGAAVDDPIEVTAARPQVLGHVGAATIRRVRHGDDQQAQAENQQGPPAAWTGLGHLLDGCLREERHRQGPRQEVKRRLRGAGRGVRCGRGREWARHREQLIARGCAS